MRNVGFLDVKSQEKTHPGVTQVGNATKHTQQTDAVLKCHTCSFEGTGAVSI